MQMIYCLPLVFISLLLPICPHAKWSLVVNFIVFLIHCWSSTPDPLVVLIFFLLFIVQGWSWVAVVWGVASKSNLYKNPYSVSLLLTRWFTYHSGLGWKVIADDIKLLAFLHLPVPQSVPPVSHSCIKVETLGLTSMSASVMNVMKKEGTRKN